jgi:CheY-like chemotaxis protein
VEGIVRSLGGAIDLTSELDKGTTFRILLRAETTAPAGERTESADVARAFQRRHGTILVVEDEDHLREAIVEMLRKSGFEVLPVENGSSAIDLLRAHGAGIDFILLDMTTPGASSREVIAQAAKVRPDIKVILTSAYSQDVTADLMSQSQVHTFIRKPFRFVDLLKVLPGSSS